MTMFWVKIIAFLTMFIDHIQYRFEIIDNLYIESIGRISFPLFAFMIGEGYSHTKNLKKYLFRLGILAIISQIPFYFFTGKHQFNIIFTLLLGMFSIIIYNKIPNKLFSAFLISCIIFLGKVLNVDYGMYGVGLVFILYLFRGNKLLLSVAYILLTTIYYFEKLFVNFSTYNLTRYLYTLIPLLIILFYSQKLGKKLNYWIYLIYPVHMIILYLVYLYVR